MKIEDAFDNERADLVPCCATDNAFKNELKDKDFENSNAAAADITTTVQIWLYILWCIYLKKEFNTKSNIFLPQHLYRHVLHNIQESPIQVNLERWTLCCCNHCKSYMQRRRTHNKGNSRETPNEKLEAVVFSTSSLTLRLISRCQNDSTIRLWKLSSRRLKQGRNRDLKTEITNILEHSFSTWELPENRELTTSSIADNLDGGIQTPYFQIFA